MERECDGMALPTVGSRRERQRVVAGIERAAMQPACEAESDFSGSVGVEK